MLKLNHQTILLRLFQLLILLVPLTWTTNTSELFEFPKIILTYTLTILIAAVWLSRILTKRQIILTKTPLDIPIMLFLLSQILSTIFSIDLHTSLWGYYSRFNGGLFSTLSYLTLYYALVSNLTKNHARTLIHTLIASLFVTSLYSFPEHFGHSPSCYLITNQFNASCWIQDVQTRVFGTFGQPNWQAAYIVTLIFLPISLLFQKAKSYNNKIKHYSLLITHYSLIIIPFSTLLFTKSRSGLLAFATGFTVLTLLTIIKAVQEQSLNIHIKKLFVVCCLLFVVFIGLGRSLIPQLNQTLNNLNFTSFTDDLAPSTTDDTPTALTGGTESGDIRKIVWQGAIDIFRLYPLFGSGTETFGYSYYNVRPQEHNLVSEWDFIYNKAHNEFLNFLATTGIFGFLSYSLIIIAFIINTLKMVLNPTSNIKHPTSILALISGFISLAVSNFFGFSTVPVSALFFLLPAISFILSSPVKQQSLEQKTKNLSKSEPFQSTLPNSPLILYTSYFILLSVTAFSLLKLHSIYTADQLYASGKSQLDAGELQPAITQLIKAHELFPQEPVYTDQLSLVLAHGAISLQQSEQTDAAKDLATQAINYSNQTIMQNSVHLNFYKTRTQVFVALTQLQPNLIDQATNTLQAAITYAPSDAKLWYNLGLLYFQLEQYNQAQELLETTVKIKPNYELARITLADTYTQLEMLHEAQSQLEYILENINPQSPAALSRLTTKD